MAIRGINCDGKSLRRLNAPIRTGSFLHAYIFAGSQEADKAGAAMEFAKAVFCRHQGERPCGACVSCGKIDHGNHEDLLYLRREGNSIGVRQIEELQLRLQNMPYASERIVSIIEDAGRMTVQSQNKLLKTLEEPNSGNMMILLAESPEQLLKTIQSRCALIRIAPAAPPGGGAMRAEAEALAEMLARGGPYCEIVKLLDGTVSDRDGGRALLDALESRFHGLVVDGAIHGRRAHLSAGDRDFAPFIDAIGAARRDLDLGMSPKFALRDMALGILP
jgi:DNA polymerase-3 subunit delta'